MITHLNKERQNDDIGSIETKELHKGVNESRHPQHLFYFHTRGILETVHILSLVYKFNKLDLKVDFQKLNT